MGAAFSPGAAHTCASRISAQSQPHTSAAFIIAARLEACGTTTDPWAGWTTFERPGTRQRWILALLSAAVRVAPPAQIPFHAFTVTSHRSMASTTAVEYSVDVIPASQAFLAPDTPML